MEGVQAASRLTGVDTHKPVWTATSVAMSTRSRSSVMRDSHCALIGACTRFRHFPVDRSCALPELGTDWMMATTIKPLFPMSEPV